MNIDTDLLRRAWPDGCLVARGVSTVGGFTCVRVYGVGDRISIWYRDHDDETVRDVVDLVRGATDPTKVPELVAGDLLPNVDPTDVATWACVLADLAHAWNPELRTRGHPLRVTHP